MDSHGVAPVSANVTLLIVSLVHFLGPFLMAAVNVALPSIGQDLNASAVQLSLTLSSYLLASAIVLLPAGRFADIYGRKQIFIIGTAILALSTLASGLATSIDLFLVLRFVQGIGSGMIFTTSIAILTAVFPPERRGRALGITVSMVYFGQSLGPSLSGLIISYLGWQWVFFFIAGCAMAALLLTMLKLKGEWAGAAGEPFDYSGSAIFSVALIMIVFGASRLIESSSAKWFLCSGMIGLVMFMAHEWRLPYPLLDLRLLTNNLPFSFSNLATFLNYATVTSFVFLFSLYLQYVKGFTPKQAGLLLIVQPVVQTLFAPIAGRLSDRYSPSSIATVGMGLCTTGLLAATSIGPNSSLVYIFVVMLLFGMSIGLFSTSNMTAIMNCVGPKHQSTAASMVATMRSLGMLFSAIAIAVIFSLYLGSSKITHETVSGFVASMRTILSFFTVLSFMGTLFSMVKARFENHVLSRENL